MIPKISIIIPVYHVEKYIAICLRSVIAQTLTEGIECILVDDCGGDRSIEIAKEIIHSYVGPIVFKIVYREFNGGLSAARNSGIEASTGEYLYFLDSDDEIIPECMQLMWNMVIKYGRVDLIKGSFYEEDETKNIRSIECMPEFSMDKGQIKKFLLLYEGDVIPAQSKMVRRDLVIKNNLFFKEGIIHEDNYWSFFLAKFVDSMCACPQAIYKHTYNPLSITGCVNVKKEILAYKTIIEELCMNIDSFLSGYQKEYILANFLTAYNYYLEPNDRRKVMSHIRQINNVIENAILDLYISLLDKKISSKILHILVRLYKM